jgi:hypothetical protein
LAEDIAALVLAALRGERLRGTIPTERAEPGQLVRYVDAVRPDPASLRFIALAMGLEVTFSPPSGTANDQAPGLRSVVVLTADGVHLALLRRDGVPPKPRPLPRWLNGAAGVTDGILAAAHASQLGPLMVADPLRTTFGSYLREVQKDVPSAEELRGIEAFVSSAGLPTGYEVRDLVLLGRDATERLFAFFLTLDEQDGQIVLDAHPLVRVRSKAPGEVR